MWSGKYNAWSGAYAAPVQRVPVVPYDPSPEHFVIERTVQHGRMLFAVVRYPNRAGRNEQKFIVFEGVTAAELRAAPRLDPHFEPGSLMPLARFAARLLCNVMRLLPAPAKT